MAMNGDQVRLLMATIEVLGGAMRLMLAERVAILPPDKQATLLDAMESVLSKPAHALDSFTSPVFLTRSELTEWMPVAAGQLIDGVREQLKDLARADAPPAARKAA